MTVFFFDESHNDANFTIGPQFLSKILRVFKDEPKLKSYRVLDGGLMHHMYCYEISSVTLKSAAKKESEGLSVATSSHVQKPNMDQFLTIICDLAETLSHNGSSLDDGELQLLLARTPLWVIVIPNLDHALVQKIHQSVSSFGPYKGYAHVDWSNPVHYQLFFEYLYKNKMVTNEGLFLQSEEEEDTVECDEELAIAEEYGADWSAKLLSPNEFFDALPELPQTKKADPRAILSVERVRGENDKHRSKVASALVFSSVEATGEFDEFSVEQSVDLQEFYVPEAKLTKYLLDINHPEGGAKAKFFIQDLGIEKADWRFLADQFTQAAKLAELYRLKVTRYGVMHGALALVTGRNGKRSVIETGWKLAENGPAQFVTAYPGDEAKTIDLTQVTGRVPDMNLERADLFEAIHHFADTEGASRRDSKRPTPMVLEEHGTIWEGACGYGWIVLSDARRAYAKWVLKNGLGHKHSTGVYISPRRVTQSVEQNTAYAEGYAEVLRANGIECSVESQLD